MESLAQLSIAAAASSLDSSRNMRSDRIASLAASAVTDKLGSAPRANGGVAVVLAAEPRSALLRCASCSPHLRSAAGGRGCHRRNRNGSAAAADVVTDNAGSLVAQALQAAVAAATGGLC